MSLSLYKKKRRFNETPEPEGKERSSKTALRFVIQKHDASHLHYDFRLEMDGVLKSWAVPKGPSLNPADKRLAMMVEDHPYDYRNFEGVIPEGNYGAGTVIVWDEGFYDNYEGVPMKKRDQEKSFLKELEKGILKIRLHGKKINGKYTLKKLKSDPGDNAWLLMKSTDEFSTETDVTKKDKSVKSGKTIAQVAKAHGTVPNHPEEKPGTTKKTKTPALAKKTSKRSAPVKKAGVSKKKSPDLNKLLKGYGDSITKRQMFRNIKPMLATLVEEPFDDPEWIYEIKWDGYRSLAYVEQGKVQLVSRNNLSFGSYTEVSDALKKLQLSAVFDGEIVAMNEKGVPDFQLLQNWQNSKSGELQFYIFDLLWVEGFDITSLPLLERKRILKVIIPADHQVLRYSDHIEGEGAKFFDLALAQGLEGIMAKAGNSTYLINKRSKDWLKIKVNKRQEVVIGGFTSPRNSRQYFGALLLGVYEGDELVYVGHTGSGFNQKSLAEIHAKLKKLQTGRSPFKKVPKANMPVTWVKPQLVCEIKFTEWTKDWIARHPIFMGLRTDKSPKDVHIEKATNITIQKENAKAKSTKKSAVVTKASPKKKMTKGKLTKTSGIQLDIKNGKDQVVKVSGQELKLTNLDKYYWKKEKIRKIDMLNYYFSIAPYMLPYMQDRPQSMHRHPNGIEGSSFYQKDTQGKVPDWIQTHRTFSESTDEYIEYLVCRDEATLIYMANAGCIEMHPWHSRSSDPDKPDWCLIDLDPEGIGFDKVIECAQVVKKVLDAIGAEAYPKTSGSTGIHIYIPLGAKYSYEQSKQLAEVVVTLVHQEIPSFTSLERSPSKRKNKIYLDYLQNRNTQTAAAPYSLRPKPGAPVSTPLYWEELKKGLTPTTYNINNIFNRLKAEGDIFRAVLGKGIDLDKVLSRIDNI